MNSSWARRPPALKPRSCSGVSTPPDMARLPHDVPTHVRHALDKALAKDPAERFADCNAFRAALSGEAWRPAWPRRVPAPPVAAAASKPAPRPKPAPAPAAAPTASAAGRGSGAQGRRFEQEQPHGRGHRCSGTGGVGVFMQGGGEDIQGEDAHAEEKALRDAAASVILIASGSSDRTIRLWNASDGRLLRTLEGHTADVNSVTFSPDGQTIASGSYDKTIRLWNASDGRHLRTLEGHRDEVLSVTFAPDGQTIASEGSVTFVYGTRVMAGIQHVGGPHGLCVLSHICPPVNLASVP